MISMCSALEVEQIFNHISGQGTKSLKGVVAGAKIRKKDGYAMMADIVNEQCITNWDAKIGESRFKSYYKKFKTTYSAYKNVSGAKFVITEADLKQGIKAELKFCYDIKYLCY